MKNSFSKGFTLIEVMAAAAFFSIVSMAVVSLVIQSARTSQKAEMIIQAGHAAVNHAEFLRGLPIDDQRLKATDSPLVFKKGNLMTETYIRDEIPLEKKAGPDGKENNISKYIRVSVFSNNSGRIKTKLSEINLIKVRAL